MLTIDQLATIDRNLRHNHLLQNEELIAEVTDHFVSAILERMASGESFDEAMEAVGWTFGGRQGLANLQNQYVQSKNRAAWMLLRSVGLSYIKGPRVFLTLFLLAGTYALLAQYGQRAFWGLLGVDLLLYYITSFGVNGLNGDTWSWKDLSKALESIFKLPVGSIRTYQAGSRWVINLSVIFAFNLPIYLYLFYFPFTFEREFSPISAVFAAIGCTVSFLVFFCIGELTRRYNPLLKRFA